jgi:GAF domain-containing protein
MKGSDPNELSRGDGAFAGPLDQETFRALLFNSFIKQQRHVRTNWKEGDRLAAMAETSRAVCKASDLRIALNLVARCAIDVTGATGAAIALLAQEQLTCCATSGPTAPPLGTPVPLDSGFSGECLRSRQPLRCDDTESDSRVNQEACARLGGVRSMLLLPLFQRRTAVGILEVFSTNPHTFENTDAHLLELLAVIAGAALTDFSAKEVAAPSVRSVSAIRAAAQSLPLG